MTAEDKDAFIKQVASVIEQQKGSEFYSYYSQLINECNTYGLTEEKFNTLILKKAFQLYVSELKKNPEDKVENRNRFVEPFGERCYNPLQLARSLFNHPFKSQEYLEDASLIKNDIAYLSNSAQAMEFGRVYKSEADPYKRYLKIVYKLHNKLPYRIGNNVSETIEELLQKGFKHHDFYDQLVDEFTKGRLQIWVNETDPESAAKLGEGYGYEDFLKFIYKVDNTYPFYINDRLFLTPADLVVEAQKNLSFWEDFYRHVENGQLPIWFDSIGKEQWNRQYQSYMGVIANSGYHDEQETKLAAVQSLICAIDPTIEVPKIEPDTKSVSLLTIQDDKVRQHAIKLMLKEKGFVKAKLAFNERINGITLRTTTATFHDLSGHTEQVVPMEIDPSHLIRNKIYRCSLIVDSVYEKIEIPVEFKVVFPSRAFTLEIIKYASLFAVFFGLLRYLLASGYADWLNRSFDYFLDWNSAYYYAGEFSLFGWLFLLFLLILSIGIFSVVSYYLFKRRSKIWA